MSLKKDTLAFLKSTKLYSIFTGTCPVCHKGKMYKESNPYKISRLFDMHERCSNCHTKFKIEPSFFFGAMYVSYGVGIIFAAIAFALAHLLFGAGLLMSFVAIVVTLFVFMPVIIRWSRNIWINFFFDYDPKRASDHSL